jgi:hypothetical protein
MDKCIDGDWPDVGNAEVPCCYGSAEYGPARCTCWESVYEVEQTEPRTDLDAAVRPSMCVDCAYRPGSPERTGDPKAAGDEYLLRRLVESGDPFWCHQGIRRPTHWRHPSGATVPGSPFAYSPPIIDGRPYKADGTPADYCGGWAAQALKVMRR